MVTASEKHLAFAEAYAGDSQAAVAQFGIDGRGIATGIVLRLANGCLTAVQEREA